MRRDVCFVALAAVLAGSCANEGEAPENLSSWGLFEDGATQTPREGVLPYEIVSPLFSDYATKHRFIQLPEGGQIAYTADGDWEYPVGTVLVKTFGFSNDLRDPSAGERIIETRLLVLEETGWEPYVYLWNEDATEAVHTPTGARVDVEWIHHDGEVRSIEYRVPNEIQCANCHGGAEPTSPIGPRAEQLDMAYDYGDGPENQLEHMASLGWFANAVPPAADRAPLAAPDDEAADLDARARAYLDANCAHCHQDGGAAGQSGLWLNAHVTEPLQLGICKRPVAAGAGTGGRTYDIVPGAPDESVMVFRMESEEPGIKMPELPTVLSHAEGVALVREWIANMEPAGCE
ncbi:MAG TPA: SO2930 family diheme c-type cytochrome [Sandaracinaceae bacterium LLY-WYZ-13_1]|nr:SO2930 family diheme c-type cytochrome [Sandaracinaceae bacterium LLY-WYZ-13_1]